MYGDSSHVCVNPNRKRYIACNSWTHLLAVRLPRLKNIVSFLKFNSALLCQVEPSFRNTRVLKDEPSLVFPFKLYLPYAREVIVALLNYGQQRLNPQNCLAVRH